MPEPLPAPSGNTAGLAYISQHYGVPAFVGARFKYEGRPGTVIGSSGPHVFGRLDDEKRAASFHPTWHMDWSTDADA